MKKITQEVLLKELNYGRNIFLSVCLMVIGLFVMLIPILDENGKKQLILILFCIVLGYPWAYVLGLKRIISLTLKRKKITSGNYRVVEDRVVDVQRRQNISTLQTLLVFEKDSAVRGKGIWFPDMVWKKVKEGDMYYLVYLGKDKESYAQYSAKDWWIDNIE